MKMKLTCFAPVVFAAALAVPPAAAAAPEDPRDTYSKDGWKLVWSDEFDGKGLVNTNDWRYEVGFVRNHEPQYYTEARAENCAMMDGSLVITARREQWPNPEYKDRRLGGWKRQQEFAKYTSAALESNRSFLYGRIEIRARLPNGQGAWPALWTLGENLRKPKDDPDYYNWPACGEIDIVEIWGNNPCRVAACLHSSKHGKEHIKPVDFHTVTGGGDRTFKGAGENPSDGLHVYTFDWYEDKIVMFYDGKRYGGATLSKSDWPEGGNPFRRPQFLIINLALGGWDNKVVDEDWTDPKTGKVVTAAKFPMEMKVDYVRYYAKAK